MKKIVCFGEIMLRLNPEGYRRFSQAEKFEATYAGGEANVAVSLANYGENSAFVTKLPKNDIAETAIMNLRKMNVDTNNIARGGERMGIYFLEKGCSQRGSKVIYDRKHSSISTAKKEDFDFKAVLADAKWFHFTGITPALSDEIVAVLEEALEYCNKNQITVSCDINYRNKLWTKEKANVVMTKLMKYVDVCIANEEDIHDVFGIKSEGTDVTQGKLNKAGYVDVAKQVANQFNVSFVAITLRGSISASVNNWAGMIYSKEEDKEYFSNDYTINIVDRVGGGDSFGGALIYALTNSYDMQQAIDFAVAGSCLKHTIEGDFNRVSVDEVKTLMSGNGSGRVQR